MKILLTGAAGFIGAAVLYRLAEEDHYVLGIDNLNTYYNPTLKIERLRNLGFQVGSDGIVSSHSAIYPDISFLKEDITNFSKLRSIFSENSFDTVIHLAAQAGVSYSISHPHDTLKNNVEGFLNILEACRQSGVSHLLFASSSSVYGINPTMPFHESDETTKPVSVYGVSKKTDELLSYSYSHLYGMKITAMRFFTVYGPMGRPDMAPWLFIDSVFKHKPISIFNNGDMKRDFTFIDDVSKSVVLLCESLTDKPAEFRIFNVGHGSPIGIMDFVRCIETVAGHETEHILKPMRDGDVKETFADCSRLQRLTGYRPDTSVEEGVKHTVEWFLKYRHLSET